MKRASRAPGRRQRQRGFSLLVGLVMLTLMTIMAIAAFKVGDTSTLVVANAQHRTEGIDAAQQTIDTVVNSINFTQNPAAAIVSNCAAGGVNSRCVDSNGDGTPDFTVTVPPPTCVAAQPIPNSALDLTQASDLACAAGVQQNFGVSGASNTNSMCANSTWEINAQAVDTATSTAVTVTQGVSVRIATADLTNNCP